MGGQVLGGPSTRSTRRSVFVSIRIVSIPRRLQMEVLISVEIQQALKMEFGVTEKKGGGIGVRLLMCVRRIRDIQN